MLPSYGFSSSAKIPLLENDEFFGYSLVSKLCISCGTFEGKIAISFLIVNLLF
jgi:hypothetical protein